MSSARPDTTQDEAIACLESSLSDLCSSKLLDSEAKSKISSIAYFIDLMDDIKYDVDVATYFKRFGRVLILQETDVQKLFDDKQGKGYRVAASSHAGLHPSHLNYIKRIHVLIDSTEGCYFADHLGDNYHYQISRESVSEFLFDAYKHGREIKVAGINCDDSHSVGDSDYVTVPPPTDGQPDVVVYTSFTPIVVSMGSGRVLVNNRNKSSGGENDTKYETVLGPSLIVCLDLALLTTKKIQSEHLCNYLHKKNNGADNFGAFERNQHNTISFGFNTLDSTDTSRGELHNLPSPSLTRRYDRFAGLGKDAKMTITLSKLAADLTAIMDALFDKVGCEKVFNDPKRLDLFAKKIHSINRFEKMTLSVSRPSELLCSHVDSHNSENLGYSGNFSHFSYHLNNGKDLPPTDPGYMRRLHIGGYGRKACDSIMKRSTNVGELISRVHEEIEATPEHRISMDPDLVLVPQENDNEIVSTNKTTDGSSSDMIARAPHMNKHVFYTFYVNVFSDWIKERRIAEDPVNWIELLEAVFSAVRWTSSPSNFATVFRQLTKDRNILIKIPQGVTYDHSKLQHVEKKEKKIPSRNLPLWLSFLFHIFEESGGVNRGRFPRFQQFAHHDIDIATVEESVHTFINHVNKLRSAIMSCDKDTPEKTKKRNRIQAVKIFVKSIAQSSKSGGVFGLGELLAFHVVGILSSGGWLDPSLIRECTDFSSGNNTAFYLLQCYELNVRTNKGIIEAIAAALPDYFPFAKVIAENVVCECSRSDSLSGGDNTSFDTIIIGENSFIPDVDVAKEGGMIARMTKKRTKKLISGVIVTETIGTQSRSNDSCVDLRVVDAPESSLLKIQSAFVKKVFKASNGYNNAKKQAFKLNARKRKGNGKGKKNKTLPKKLQTHQPKWGYKPYSMKRVNLLKGSRLKAMAEGVVQEYFNNVVGIARSFGQGDSTMLSSLESMKISNCRQFSTVSNEIQQLFTILGENPLSLEDDITKDGTTYYQNQIAKYVEDFHDLVFNGNSISRKRKKKKQSRNENSGDDCCDSDEDYKDINEMELSTYCIGAKLSNGKFIVLPRASALNEMPTNNFFHFDPLHYIGEATLIKRNSLKVIDLVESKNGWNFYRSRLDIKGTTYESSDKVFCPSSNSKQREAFVVGSFKIGSGTLYESITHSRFALMMVVLKRLNKSFEDLFLPHQDVAIGIPDENFAYDPNDSSSQRTQLPICAFLRTVHGIVCVDFDQLKYIDQSRSMRIDRGCGNLPIDLHTHVWDQRIKDYVELCQEKRKYYELKKQKISKYNEGIVQFIDSAEYIIGHSMPLNAVKIEICGDDFEDDAVPNGFTRCAIRHNPRNERVDHYYFSPKQKIRFRSKVEVQKFSAILKDTKGDESEAFKIYKSTN